MFYQVKNSLILFSKYFKAVVKIFYHTRAVKYILIYAAFEHSAFAAFMHKDNLIPLSQTHPPIVRLRVMRTSQ